MKEKTLFLLVGAACLAALFWPQPGRAVPSFARKYGISCQACHVAFPELTPMGEGYMRNGFRYPGDLDRQMSKIKDIPLGADAENQLFPNSVWSGSLPGEVPFSAMLEGAYTYFPENKELGTVDNHSFEDLGGSMGLFLAGTMGNRFSFWAEADLSSGEVDVHRAFVQINFLAQPRLNLRVGRFFPDMMEKNEHRSLLEESWISERTVGDNLWTQSPEQGLELSGNNGRLGYNLGLVENNANLQNRDKDYYLRLEYKIGGLNLDGTAGKAKIRPQPWRDDSIVLSGFYYSGSALMGDTLTGLQTDRFYRAGGDALASYWNLRLWGGYFTQLNQQPLLAAPGEEVKSSLYFVELEWVAYPWLIPLARFEHYASDLPEGPENQLAVGIVALVRPNVRVRVAGNFDAANGESLKTRSVRADLEVGL